MASANAQSIVLFSSISLRAASTRSKPLWMTNSAAFGGGDEKRLPMCTSVSSITPVGATFRGSLPSKKPDHGESIQSLYLMCVSVFACSNASSQIFSYLSLTLLTSSAVTTPSPISWLA
uniref:Putative secreted protein n=1 Tax=Anopheles darlingi TaxID=43151 RepID=A0A2M4DFG7_ANODA